MNKNNFLKHLIQEKIDVFNKKLNERKINNLNYKIYLNDSSIDILNEKLDNKNKNKILYKEYLFYKQNKKIYKKSLGDYEILKTKIDAKNQKLEKDILYYQYKNQLEKVKKLKEKVQINNAKLQSVKNDLDVMEANKKIFEENKKRHELELDELQNKFLENKKEKVQKLIKKVEINSIKLKKRLKKLEKKVEKYLDTKPIEEQIQKLKEKIQKLTKKVEINSIKIKEKIEIKSIKLEEKIQKLTKKIEINSIKLKEKIQKLEYKKADLGKNNKSNKTAKKIYKNEVLISNNQDLIKTISSKDTHLYISRLSMFFGGIKAVNDLSFEIKRGEIFGLIGPNGAGKTTVFNCITQFYNPTYGNSFLKRKDNTVYRLNDYKTHEIITLGISRTFQNVELILELTVLENLLIGAHSLFKSGLIGSSFNTPRLKKEEQSLRIKAISILKKLNILDYCNVYPVGLPYGILKKIELARSLMSSPELIILDEPAAGLNDAESTELSQVIKDIRDEYNVTIFLVEHDMSLVMGICDRICAINFGEKIAVGTPKQISSNLEVKKAYLGGD